MPKDYVYLDYFNGGVPPGALFSVDLADSTGVLMRVPIPKHGLDEAAELFLIGLVAYFEAFCRNHFAALVNICPALIEELKKKGRDVSVDTNILLMFKKQPWKHLGFLLAEKYDFGTPRSINGLYMDLLQITPFSKDEAKQFERLLNDRNLLVHHGGVYTVRYAGQTLVKRQTRQRIFFNSLVIRRRDVEAAAAFLTEIAKKIMKATQAALIKYINENKIRISQAQQLAIDNLAAW